jgi:hypothetical protein
MIVYVNGVEYYHICLKSVCECDVCLLTIDKQIFMRLSINLLHDWKDPKEYKKVKKKE